MTFLEFARAHGLVLDHIPAAGKWHRVKTETHPHQRNGSVKLADDGRRGWVQDHAAHSEPLMWTAGADVVLPMADPAAVARRKRAEREAQARAIREMAKYWKACKPLRGGHPYLESHGLRMLGCGDLRVDADGWLVVPAMREINFYSIQRISPAGDKRFWPGAPMSGCYYVIERRGATLTVIVEGLATGLAVFAACPLARVIVAFDAGNMAKLQIPMRGLATVAADNDIATADRLGRNPGLDAATSLSARIGAGVAVPEGIAGTDWCDWRQEKRAERMKRRGRFESEAQVLKAVDEALAREIMQAAKFLRPLDTAKERAQNGGVRE
jgi:putative DNA primase/helicase